MRYSRVMEFLKYKGWITWMLPIAGNKQKEEEEKMRYSRVMEFLITWSWKQTEGEGRKEDKILQGNGVPEI